MFLSYDLDKKAFRLLETNFTCPDLTLLEARLRAVEAHPGSTMVLQSLNPKPSAVA